VCTENPIRIDWLGVVTLSQTEPNLPTTANLDPRDFIDLACWLIVQTGPISLNVTTPRHLNRRDIFKQNRAAALAEWRQLAV
jgi:hypothetical protein